MWIDDDLLVRCSDRLAVSTWIPDRSMVVLGSSNVAESEVNVEQCAADGVPVLKRYGGGGTVLLYPGCIVVSVGAWVKQHFQNKFYFEGLNQAVIDAMATEWPLLGELAQRGLSDIVFRDRKVAGTSLFRSRNYLLYQASILVEMDAQAINRYLKHPTKEPDYRQGRSHATFLVGLTEVVPGLTAASCHGRLVSGLTACLEHRLGDELIDPEVGQFAALEARRARSASNPA